MSIWNLHLLNARKRLIPVMADVRVTVRDAVARAGDHVDLPPFDIVVRAEDGPVPDGGILARTPACGVIEVTLALRPLDNALLMRVLVREMAHLIRRDGRGSGQSPVQSLGEALVGEGLAGHFVSEVLGIQPGPADLPRVAPAVMRQAMNEWARRDYDHARWFGGKGDLRRGTGQSLGHRLVDDHLARTPGDTAASLITAPAEPFRQNLRRIAAAEVQGEPDTASGG